MAYLSQASFIRYIQGYFLWRTKSSEKSELLPGADGYSRVNQEELHSEQKEKWKEVLMEQLPKKEKDQVQILDIGTGPGFFAIL